MPFPEDFANRLEAITGLVALVGARIYPGGVPQEPTLPAVAFRTVSGDANPQLDTSSLMATLQVEISVWDKTLSGAYAATTALRVGLETAPIGTTGAITVGKRQSWGDEYVPEVKSWVVIQRYLIFHRE